MTLEAHEFLAVLADALDRLDMPYLVTGSTATSAYGEPRLTNDIDIVIAMRRNQIDAVCAAFPAADFYVSRVAVESAVRDAGQFNILHPRSGLKADMIIASNSEFDQSRLSRRREVPALPNRMVWFASPEDVIVKKLLYYIEGRSEKHIRDIAGVLRVQGKAVDRQYISDWARKLRIDSVWSQVLEIADENAS